jgi:hypothetical protein
MQGVELTLLWAFCCVVCGYCTYTNNYTFAFLVLLLGDFFAIQGKTFFGFQLVGIYKESILLLICVVLIFHARQSLSDRLWRIFLVTFAGGLLVISIDYRPFSALILAAVVGILVAECRGRIMPPIASLTMLCFFICAYQYINITDFEQLWFYDFLYDKAGEDFVVTYHAYFRDEKLRPPGFLVSPSTFGFVFILLTYLIEKYKYSPQLIIFIKLLCIGGLLMIQTRALLIIFIAFELQQRIFQTTRSVVVLIYYFVLLMATILLTTIYGNEGALVRILLLSGLFTDLTSGIGWLPFSSLETAPVDSQFVSFVRMFGLLGIIAIFYVVHSVKQQSRYYKNENLNIELAFVCVLLFINIFQWSESSPGNLLGWLMLGYFYRKNKLSLVRVDITKNRQVKYLWLMKKKAENRA